jgi:hypothetical protein
MMTLPYITRTISYSRIHKKVQQSGLLSFTMVSGMLVFPFIALADAAPAPDITIKPVTGFVTLSQALNTIITAAIFFGAILAFGYIAMGAFKYVAAGDDANAVKSARTMIQNAVIGLILLGLIFVIIKIIVPIIPGLSNSFA